MNPNLTSAFTQGRASPRKGARKEVHYVDREEPEFSNQSSGGDALVYDTDDEEPDTEDIFKAADAQLRAEAARQTRQSPTRATQRTVSAGSSTGAKRSALPPKGGPSAKKLTFTPPLPTLPRAPAFPLSDYVPSGKPPPVSYLGSNHSMATSAVQLTPQENKDIDIDRHIMECVTILRNRTLQFCHKFFNGKLDFDTSDLHAFLDILKTGTRETVSFAGCIADGGPTGLKGWVEIIRDSEYRQALICGMIQRALKEHVFGALLFGGPADIVETLEDLEEKQKNEDGFIRAESRAQVIVSHELYTGKTIGELPEYGRAIVKLAVQLRDLIRPIYALHLKEMTSKIPKAFTQGLIQIVSDAANLALFMRRNGDTVLYHFFPIFKGEDIDPAKTECLNLNTMRQAYTESKKKGEIHALVRVVCAFHLVAYRKGGGVMAERILEKESKEPDTSIAPELRHRPRNVYRGRIITAKDGFRSKMLCKALVAGSFSGYSGMADKGEDDGTVELLDIFKKGEAKKAVEEAAGLCAVM